MGLLFSQTPAQRLQKEREDLIWELQNKGHECIEIKESYPIQVGWCKQYPCKGIFILNETPNELVDKLYAQGHTCVTFNHLTNDIEWCERDPCNNSVQNMPVIIDLTKGHKMTNPDLDKMKQRQKIKEELVDRLREEGHECIQVKESYPIQVSWCESNRCKGS